MICRITKRPERRGQVLFINAVNEVERKNAQSFLEDKHIQRIAKAYQKYANDSDFARVVTIKDIEENKFSLSIPLYVKPASEMIELEIYSVQDRYDNWRAASKRMQSYYEKLSEMLRGEDRIDE